MNLMKRRSTLALLALAAAPLFAQAQSDRPIRLVVPYPAGGPLDTIARVLAEKTKDTLGTVIVENRAGAGGNIGADQVARSAADGHTIVMGAIATQEFNPWL